GRLIENFEPNRSIQLPSDHSLNDRAMLVMHFKPLHHLRIDLIWKNQWSKTHTRNVTLHPDQSIQTIFNQNGNIISSVWAFGGGYKQFLKNQLHIAKNDITPSSTILSDSTGNG